MATVAMSPGPVSGAGWDLDGYLRRPEMVGARACGEVLDRVQAGEPLDREPLVADLAASLVSGLLGAAVPAEVASAAVTITRPGASGIPWSRPASGPGGVHALAVVALARATLATGCPVVVPGSHRDAAHDPPALPVVGAVPVPLERGDVLVVDGRLLHRRTDNHSIDTTAALVVAFRRPGG